MIADFLFKEKYKSLLNKKRRDQSVVIKKKNEREVNALIINERSFSLHDSDLHIKKIIGIELSEMIQTEILFLMRGSEIGKIILSIANELDKFYQKNNRFHFDLKPEHIIIDEIKQIYLIDLESVGREESYVQAGIRGNPMFGSRTNPHEYFLCQIIRYIWTRKVNTDKKYDGKDLHPNLRYVYFQLKKGKMKINDFLKKYYKTQALYPGSTVNPITEEDNVYIEFEEIETLAKNGSIYHILLLEFLDRINFKKCINLKSFIYYGYKNGFDMRKVDRFDILQKPSIDDFSPFSDLYFHYNIKGYNTEVFKNGKYIACEPADHIKRVRSMNLGSIAICANLLQNDERGRKAFMLYLLSSQDASAISYVYVSTDIDLDGLTDTFVLRNFLEILTSKECTDSMISIKNLILKFLFKRNESGKVDYWKACEYSYNICDPIISALFSLPWEYRRTIAFVISNANDPKFYKRAGKFLRLYGSMPMLSSILLAKGCNTDLFVREIGNILEIYSGPNKKFIYYYMNKVKKDPTSEHKRKDEFCSILFKEIFPVYFANREIFEAEVLKLSLF